MHRILLGLMLLGWIVLPRAEVCAQGPASDPASGARARLDGEWLYFEVGTDETAQVLQLRVWGTLRDSSYFWHGFQQLDEDPELEYVIISRNEGTGPYYKLQIVDLQPNGILTWSYDSYERPKAVRGAIELGTPPQAGGSTTWVVYRLTPHGLERSVP